MFARTRILGAVTEGGLAVFWRCISDGLTVPKAPIAGYLPRRRPWALASAGLSLLVHTDMFSLRNRSAEYASASGGTTWPQLDKWLWQNEDSSWWQVRWLV